MIAVTLDQSVDFLRSILPERSQSLCQLGGREESRTDRLVIPRQQTRAHLLESVRERIVPDVVKQRGIGHQFGAPPDLLRYATPLSQEPQRSHR